MSLCENNKLIIFKDFGVGSNINKNKERKIKDIAKNSSKNKKFGELLYRIVKYFKPTEIFELGTSFGISTLYLSKANSNSNITTFEGCKESAKIAIKNFKKLDCTNIDTIIGEFGETFSKKLAEKSNVNMLFIDGNHSEDATIRYFEESIKYSDQKTILIFDDIHWSSGMEKAWDYIKKSQKTRVTVDLFFVGLVFLDQKLSKENFIIRF
jgi:predicted O-methyltransferase YrrM